MSKKLYFNWSTGKDSALALHYLLENPEFEVGHLLTTINAHFNRVSMYGLRRELMEAQIDSIGIPFSTVELPEQPNMEEYEVLMNQALQPLKAEGFHHTGFGDIFLEDLRKYREDKLSETGITAHFPLWKRDTKELLNEFLKLGFKSIVICAKSELLNESFVGRIIDADFINDLPSTVDPCGENGEFHTFCFDGPIFSKPVAFEVGETVFKAYKNPENCGGSEDKGPKPEMGFWYCDLIPVNLP